jgi:nucleoside-diphosphate-sugar epimerase
MERMVREVDPARLAWTILRGASFVGPGTAQVALLDRLRAGAATVAGDGRSWVSFIHVEDMAEATLLALDAAPPGSVFNIADEPVRNGHYLQHLAELLAAPTPTTDPTKPAPPSFRCSAEAARNVLRWVPRVGIWPKLAD